MMMMTMIVILKVLSPYIMGRVRASGQLSECFRTSSGVRQGWHPDLFKFVMNDVFRQALKNSSANFRKTVDNTSLNQEYVDDCVHIGSVFESLTTKGRIYNVTVRSILPYGCETWPLGLKDLHRLQVHGHRYLRLLKTFSLKNMDN